jgi:hypothetical protein
MHLSGPSTKSLGSGTIERDNANPADKTAITHNKFFSPILIETRACSLLRAKRTSTETMLPHKNDTALGKGKKTHG